MILAEEPLPHEVFGLQILIGAVGTQIAGFVGCLMGTFQVAPCLSWLPGKAGNGVRAIGWQAFAVMRAGARSSVTVWRASGMQAAAGAVVDASQNFDRTHRISARTRAACLVVLRVVWRSLLGVASTFATAGGAAARHVGGGSSAAKSPSAGEPQGGGGAPPSAPDDA